MKNLIGEMCLALLVAMTLMMFAAAAWQAFQ